MEEEINESNCKTLTNTEIRSLFKNMNELYKLFLDFDNILVYSGDTQSQISELLNKIAIISRTYQNNIDNEEENIDEDLTIINRETGQRERLVNPSTMNSRVRNVLDINDKYTCLKSLALSNKIAHSFQGSINSKAIFIANYYNMIFPNEPTAEDNISFLRNLSVSFPKLVGMNKYNVSTLTDYEFEKLIAKLDNNFAGTKEGKVRSKKISILKQLHIDFDPSNKEDIDNKCAMLVREKNYIIASYLVKKYKEGQKLAKLQSKMYAVKDILIVMVTQLLANNELDNNFELIRTGGEPGFEYMLAIDDRSLSYYIEVHMPDTIANMLMNELHIPLSTNRRFENLGASAVYRRDKKEVRKIRRVLEEPSQLIHPVRAKIISRGDESEPVPEPESNDHYIFVTKRKPDQPSLFEQFLLNDPKYKEYAEESMLHYHNEQYPINVIRKSLNDNYKELYRSFNYDYKINFINFAIDHIEKGDLFDNELYNLLYLNNLSIDIDTLGELFIDLEEYKDNCIKYNDSVLNQSKYDDKHIIEMIIKDSTNEFINNNILDKFDNTRRR